MIFHMARVATELEVPGEVVSPVTSDPCPPVNLAGLPCAAVGMVKLETVSRSALFANPPELLAEKIPPTEPRATLPSFLILAHGQGARSIFHSHATTEAVRSFSLSHASRTDPRPVDFFSPDFFPALIGRDRM